jgi:hypothetical protein
VEVAEAEGGRAYLFGAGAVEEEALCEKNPFEGIPTRGLTKAQIVQMLSDAEKEVRALLSALTCLYGPRCPSAYAQTRLGLGVSAPISPTRSSHPPFRVTHHTQALTNAPPLQVDDIRRVKGPSDHALLVYVEELRDALRAVEEGEGVGR